MSLVSKKEIADNVIEIEIKVEKDDFDKAFEKSFKKNSQKMTVQGFRKGKAPRSVILQMYGKEAFFEDAVNFTYPEAYDKEVEALGVEPVEKAKVEVLELDENGYSFKATFAVRPEVKVSNYFGIKAEKKVDTVKTEDIEKEIDRLKERNARLVDVTDRKTQKEDTVEFDFEGFVDGELFEGGKAEHYTLVLGSGQFIPGFEEQMEDKNIGDEFDVNVSFPDDYHAEELKGKPAVFKGKLHEIKGKEYPEIDDEFAKDVSEFDTLEELKADLGKKLQERLDKTADEEFENKLIDNVIENMEAKIPEVMFENTVDSMVAEFEQRLKSQGLSLELYLQYNGMDFDSFKKTFREQAERRVRIRLALEEIVKLESIAAAEEDVENEIKKMADMYKMEYEKIKELLPRNEIEKDIAVNKAIDLIKQNAVSKKEKSK